MGKQTGDLSLVLGTYDVGNYKSGCSFLKKVKIIARKVTMLNNTTPTAARKLDAKGIDDTQTKRSFL
ncbi:MAG: hypothetical protein ACTS73_06540 [Arsenophonus sp. NEOnobi-MAG3]